MAKLPDHGHCENCGDPIEFGERFCSDECSNKYSNDDREEKNKEIRFYAIMAGAVVAAAVIVYAVKVFLL
jgi:predicted nucleic acid-binding Zn ribbon protein